MQRPSKPKSGGSSPPEGISGGYGVTAALEFVELSEAVQIRLATKQNRPCGRF